MKHEIFQFTTDLLNQLDEMILSVANGRINFINHAASDYFDLDINNLSDPRAQSLQVELLNLLKEHIKKKSLSHTTLNLKYIPKNTIEHTVHWTILPAGTDTLNNIIYLFIGKIQSEKRALEMQLKRLEDEAKKILDSAPGKLYWKDLESRYVGANKEWLELVGLSSVKQIIGKKDEAFFGASKAKAHRLNDKIVTQMARTIVEEESVELETGEVRYFIATKMPKYNANNEIVGIIGNSIDITDKKKLESELIKAKEKAEAANRSKSELIANVSHDFRNLLASMDGMIGKMAWDIEEKERNVTTTSATHTGLKDFIQTLQHDNQQLMEATQEFLQLCENILEAMRLESGQLTHRIEVFDLDALLKHTVTLLRLMAQDKGLSLSYHLDTHVPRCLRGKRLALDRILLNLVGNALKFTSQGFVRIPVTLAEPHQTSLSCKPGDRIEIKIAVEDSGIGIPVDKQEQIFGRFERLTPAYEGIYKGSGLGLYTVKQYMEYLQGQIQVTSEVGRGSCFTVTVPFTVADPGDIEFSKVSKGEANTHSQSQAKTAKAPSAKKSLTAPRQDSDRQATTRDKPAADLSAEALAKAEASAKTDSAQATVLVVEDNPMAAIGIQMKLKQLHCIVDWAKNGTEALQMAQSKQYDCIFMDIGLPDFMGIEATKKIRALSDRKHTEVPIVAVTGHAGNPERQQACFDAGMQAVLSKPTELLELQSTLSTYVLSTKSETLAEPKGINALERPQVDMSVIDWTACIELCKGDNKSDEALAKAESVVREMLSVLAQDLKDTKSVLAKAYANRNASVLHAELHRLRGGVCYLKCPELECCLKAFHEAVKADPQDDTQLELTYTALQQAMQSFWKTWETGRAV